MLFTGLAFRLPPEIAADRRRFPPANDATPVLVPQGTSWGSLGHACRQTVKGCSDDSGLDGTEYHPPGLQEDLVEIPSMFRLRILLATESLLLVFRTTNATLVGSVSSKMSFVCGLRRNTIIHFEG